MPPISIHNFISIDINDTAWDEKNVTERNLDSRNCQLYQFNKVYKFKNKMCYDGLLSVFFLLPTMNYFPFIFYSDPLFILLIQDATSSEKLALDAIRMMQIYDRQGKTRFWPTFYIIFAFTRTNRRKHLTRQT
jgi:hypothetical protein